MIQFKQLNIRGFQRRTVPNTIVSHSGGSEHLAVLYPGLSYTVQMPVLYYPGQLLTDLGADVLQVDSRYDQSDEYGVVSEEEKARWRGEDALAALDAALAQGGYTQVTLVGKSIGSLALGHLLEKRRDLPNLTCIWLTPLIKHDGLRHQMGLVKHRALLVIGTADAHYNQEMLAQAQRITGGEPLVIEGANHSLEFPGDLARSLKAMGQVIEKIKGVLS